jgi:hypothetical protein
MLDDSWCAGFSGLAVQEAHDDRLLTALVEELAGSWTGGGVMHHGCIVVMYELFRILQKETNSGPSSIAPFNLIP